MHDQTGIFPDNRRGSIIIPKKTIRFMKAVKRVVANPRVIMEAIIAIWKHPRGAIKFFLMFLTNSRALRWFLLLCQIYDSDLNKLRQDLASGCIFSEENPLGMKSTIAAYCIFGEGSLKSASGRPILIRNITTIEVINAISQVPDIRDRLKPLLIRYKGFEIRQNNNSAVFPKTSQFFLDLLLPPERADETYVALRDIYEQRWYPRYGGRRAQIICQVQIISAVTSFHGDRIRRLVGTLCGISAMRKLWTWLWG